VGTARQRLLPIERASLLLLIRHAHTSAVGTSLSGRTDNVPLSEQGRQQLVALCQALRGVRIDAVYSSPLERARATAQAVADERELTINLRDELLEVDFGEWTGKTFVELEALPEWQAFNRRRSAAQIPGGEHATAIVARATRALEAIARGHPGETVAAITHAEVIRSAVLHYQRRSLDLYHEIDVPPASITEIRLSAKGAEVLSVGRSSA
jgi:probable phosphoglycerate mutase